MQILFIRDSNTIDTVNKDILNYKKSLNRNILYVDVIDLYESNGFVYAKNLLILKDNTMAYDILLSPSMVINIANEKVQSKIDLYINKFWINTQQIFYNINKNSCFNNELHIYDILKQNDSFCYAYIEDLSNPTFKVFEETIFISQESCIGFEQKYLKGFIEFSLTEYFISYCNQNSLGSNVNNKSAAILVEFNIHPNFGDFTIDIQRVASVNFLDLINYNNMITFNYFDLILNHRIEKFTSKLFFRDKIYQEAKKNNVEFEPSCKNFFILMKDQHAGFQKAYFGGVNTHEGLTLANDKHKTNKHLKKYGFNVNKSQQYSLKSLSTSKDIEELNFKYPIVLKPADKQGGYGVFVNIKDNEKLLEAVKVLIDMKDVSQVIIEEFFIGLTYRFFVVGGETKAILKFEFPNIVGDGESSIEQLIKSKNKLSKSKIKLTDVIKLTLDGYGYDYKTILAKGKKIILSYDSHPSLGGGAVDVTNMVDTTYKDLAVRVSKSMNLDISGIDFMINKKGDYKIIEVNTAPAMATHLEPQYGNSINVYYYVMQTMLTKTKIDGPNSFFPDMVYYHK